MKSSPAPFLKLFGQTGPSSAQCFNLRTSHTVLSAPPRKAAATPSTSQSREVRLSDGTAVSSQRLEGVILPRVIEAFRFSNKIVFLLLIVP